MTIHPRGRIQRDVSLHHNPFCRNKLQQAVFPLLRLKLWRKIKIRTRLQPIQTASEIHTKIIINPFHETPLYQKLAKTIAKFRLLGIPYKEIARKLKISEKTALKAYKFYREAKWIILAFTGFYIPEKGTSGLKSVFCMKLKKLS